ncbi:hypothetical protein FNV43_RR12611 [Rhamnella rubrinervis]|uniref:50S ribosomal protein 6, chloroplastic n=1 Tax=Rhamnella rubrinervis TaxID=2594499 RepID=A0A8K0MJ18_9ROSA|nr:hypothetical protein FNV43_RR12611 [Rhamnella rubrinervis]
MLTSTVFGARAWNPSATALLGASGGAVRQAAPCSGGGCGLVIECSSRPQKKATAHHRKTRPRKTQPWDVKRKPTVYAPLPPLPPDWTVVSDDSAAAAASSSVSVAETPPTQAPSASPTE